jgi:hypothetical protein
MVTTKHQEVHKYHWVIDPKNVAARIDFFSIFFFFPSLSLLLSLLVARALRIRT